MRTLSLLHRWIGAVAGVLLAVLGLSGAILVWRDELTTATVSIPKAESGLGLEPAQLARIAVALAPQSNPVDRITFASEGLDLNQVTFADGAGVYLDRSGEVVAHWTSIWQRPELWLFDLHHHFLLGEAGKTATGIVGIIGLFFIVSGAILWWRVRTRFRPRLWPIRMTPGAIVHHHRDMGVLTAPLLLVSLLTGVLMVFPLLGQPFLGKQERPSAPQLAGNLAASHHGDYALLFARAQECFPGAEPRRLQWPRKPYDPMALRMRRDFEWTPNGGTYVYADPTTMTIISVAAPSHARTSIREKLYPVHAARTGGLMWKLVMTLSGLALTLLGSLAVYGFWRTRFVVRNARRNR